MNDNKDKSKQPALILDVEERPPFPAMAEVPVPVKSENDTDLNLPATPAVTAGGRIGIMEQ